MSALKKPSDSGYDPADGLKLTKMRSEGVEETKM